MDFDKGDVGKENVWMSDTNTNKGVLDAEENKVNLVYKVILKNVQ